MDYLGFCIKEGAGSCWWHRLLIPALKQREKDLREFQASVLHREFRARQGSRVRPCLIKKKKKPKGRKKRKKKKPASSTFHETQSPSSLFITGVWHKSSKPIIFLLAPPQNSYMCPLRFQERPPPCPNFFKNISLFAMCLRHR